MSETRGLKSEGRSPKAKVRSFRNVEPRTSHVGSCLTGCSRRSRLSRSWCIACIPRLVLVAVSCE